VGWWEGAAAVAGGGLAWPGHRRGGPPDPSPAAPAGRGCDGAVGSGFGVEALGGGRRWGGVEEIRWREGRD
jgi:hypothetical protein